MSSSVKGGANSSDTVTEASSWTVPGSQEHVTVPRTTGANSVFSLLVWEQAGGAWLLCLFLQELAARQIYSAFCPRDLF